MAGDKHQIQRAQQGDRDAFAVLIDAHYDRIYRFCLKFCGSQADAEDISQLACIKLAHALPQFRFESAFTTWLYALVLNCARDWEKGERRHRSTGELEDVPGVSANADALIYLAEVLSRIEQMGTGFKETVLLVLGEGLTHAEVAAILAIQESTVSWRIHEVRKRLGKLAPEGSR